MKRFVVALLIMTTGLLPVFGADESDFFVSSSAIKASAMVSVRDDQTRLPDQATENSRRNGIVRYTILRFESKLGKIDVQPLLGKVNGAQLYVSF